MKAQADSKSMDTPESDQEFRSYILRFMESLARSQAEHHGSGSAAIPHSIFEKLCRSCGLSPNDARLNEQMVQADWHVTSRGYVHLPTYLVIASENWITGTSSPSLGAA